MLGAMPRAVWTGSIGFGLVSIPVRLFNATSPKDVRFHQFDRTTGRRIHYRRVADGPDSTPTVEPPSFAGAGPSAGHEAAGTAPDERDERPAFREPAEPERRGEEVAYADVVKGYELESGGFVMVDPEEIRGLRPERSRTIEITDFVSLDDIDPVYFDRSYFVLPQRGGGAEKPYGLLLRAMQRSRRVGIGSFVLSSKPHLAAIRPREDALILETLFFSDEVRSASEVDVPPSPAEPSTRELDVAVKLIELLAAEWDPSRYRDSYREQVLALIESKAGTEFTVAEERVLEASGVADLMAALQASVEAAKKSSSGRRKAGRRRTG